MPAPTLSEYKQPLYMMELHIHYEMLSVGEQRAFLRTEQGRKLTRWLRAGAYPGVLETEVSGEEE